MGDFGVDWYSVYRGALQYVDFGYRLFARWWMKCGAVVRPAPPEPAKPDAAIPKVVESLETAFRTNTSTYTPEDRIVTAIRFGAFLLVASVIYYLLLKLYRSLAALINWRDDPELEAMYVSSTTSLIDPDSLPVHNPNRKSSRRVLRPVAMSKPVPATGLLAKDRGQVKSDPKEMAGSPLQISDPSGSRHGRHSNEHAAQAPFEFIKQCITTPTSRNPSSSDADCSSSSLDRGRRRSPKFIELTEKTQRTESMVSPVCVQTIIPDLRSMSTISGSSSNCSAQTHFAADKTQKSDDPTQLSNSSRTNIFDGATTAKSPDTSTQQDDLKSDGPTLLNSNSLRNIFADATTAKSPDTSTQPDDRLAAGADPHMWSSSSPSDIPVSPQNLSSDSSRTSACTESALRACDGVSQTPIGILQMFPNSSMLAGCSECQMRKLRPVVFKWPDSSAQSVFVTGSFVNWESKIALFKEPKDGGWSVQVRLPRGHHEYKFIVDKRWSVDHKRQPTIRDKDGDWSNVIHV
ncbi:hypothetical protein QR680_008855 [Steinernema hermaphroditum]|uniref:5'-AMP-activated protein kinase subunit beta-1 n=1 Tax=Steinernema hermaphroditum TaxID=289476 RepID=A0AA39II56_9BILA|nr:hypothetical protein QR680_008855 [Steinernema hermaphroditum]